MVTKRTGKSDKKYNDTDKLVEIGKVQPQALDVEEAVLGACLIEQDAFGMVSDILEPDSFYDQKHQIIYATIKTLAAENKPIDILTITEQLKADKNLDKVGGPFYIAELSQKILSSAHIEYHAKIIAGKALARKLIAYTSLIREMAFDEGQDMGELMQTAEGKLFELSKLNQKKDFTQIDPVIDEAYELLKNATNRGGGLSGLSSGFTVLDNITSGWQNSDLIIIAARPAMGKTAFVLSMCKNIAVDMKTPVAMFSLEMSNVQLVNRLITNVCEIKGDIIKSGLLRPYEWSQLDYKIKDLYKAPLYIDDTPSLSVFELRTKARRLVREFEVKLIVIDYLQLMNASGMSYNSRQEEVATISRSLKSLAKELNIPIIALSQLNRGVESRVGQDTNDINSKRPQLADLRESGAIEQDADLVCFIHRWEYYKIYKDPQGNDTKGTAEIILAKHRNGATGEVTLKFESEYAKFSNIKDGSDSFPTEEETMKPSKLNRINDNSNDDALNSITDDMEPGGKPPF